MKITIESTTKLVMLREPGGSSIPARIWQGHTETGIPVMCLIPRIAPTITEPLPADVAQQFAAELTECAAPRAEIESFPLRLIL